MLNASKKPLPPQLLRLCSRSGSQQNWCHSILCRRWQNVRRHQFWRRPWQVSSPPHHLPHASAAVMHRCVLLLGLPFPNKHDPELQERMKHINSTKDNVFHLDSHNYYEDLCMKAVNQSIGRVIRHIQDYACIVLADERYSHSSIIQKLPQWIQPSFQGACTFGQAFSKAAQFFKRLHKSC